MASYASERRSRPGILLLIGILLGAGALTVFSRKATNGVWNHLAAAITGRKLSIDTSMPTVVASIQRLQRLETVNYTMDKIVEGDRESEYLPSFLTGDKLLLVVHGQVLAGVDLGKITASDIQVNERQATIHLPPAQIFIATLDNSKTHVYSRETGMLVTADPNLESQVRQQAVDELQQAALTNGVLDTAQKNARATVTTLLQSLGFQQVSFR